MQVEIAFSCRHPNGIADYEAQQLMALCQTFDCHIHLFNRRNHKESNVKNAKDVLNTHVQYEDPCIFYCYGLDAPLAQQALQDFVNAQV